MAATPNIFSVSPSTPFLQATVAALLSGQLIPGFQADDDPLVLADVTIYVPTRRAARTLPDVLRRALGSKAALLPKILPLGDVDEEEHILKGHGDGEALPPRHVHHGTQARDDASCMGMEGPAPPPDPAAQRR